MSITYTPANFSSKDALPSGHPDKIVSGSDFDTEFAKIQASFLLAAPAADPVLTGDGSIGGEFTVGTNLFTQSMNVRNLSYSGGNYTISHTGNGTWTVGPSGSFLNHTNSSLEIEVISAFSVTNGFFGDYFVADSNGIKMPNIPTSDPAEAGRLWNDGGTLKISAG